MHEVTAFNGYNSLIQRLLALADRNLMEFLQPILTSLNGWEEHDRIVFSRAIAPVLKLLEQGWSSSDVLELEDWELLPAASSGETLSSFRSRCNDLGVTSETNEDDIIAMLRGKYTREEKYIARHIPAWEQYCDSLPGWVRKSGCLSAFTESVHIRNLTKYHLKAISKLDANSFFAVQGMPGSLMVNLCLLPLYQKKQCSPMQGSPNCKYSWVRVMSEDQTLVYPMYRWWEVQELLTGYDGEAKVRFTDGILNIIFCKQERPVMALPRLVDADDPVLDFVEAAAKRYDVELSVYSNIELHSKVYMAFMEVVRKNYDWLLWLQFPRLFNVMHKYYGGSLADTIVRAAGVTRKARVERLENAWFLLEQKAYSVYVHYLMDGLEKSKVAGGIFIGKDRTNMSTVIKHINAINYSMRK